MARLKLKTKKVMFRLSERELEQLDEKAKFYHMSRSKYILYRCLIVN